MRSAMLRAAAVLLLGASLVSASIASSSSPSSNNAHAAWTQSSMVYMQGTSTFDVPPNMAYSASYSAGSNGVPKQAPFANIKAVDATNGNITGTGLFILENGIYDSPVVVGDSAYVGDGAVLKGFRNDTWQTIDPFNPTTPTWTATSALPCNVSILAPGPGMLVAACDTGAIFAVDIASKAIRWAASVSTGTSDASVFNVQVSWCTLTSSYTVLVFGGQSATLFDAMNGTVMWTIQNSTWPSVLAGPAPVISTDGNTVFFGVVSGGLEPSASVFAVAAGTGYQLWSQQLNATSVDMNIGPVLTLVQELDAVIVAYLSTPQFQSPSALQAFDIINGDSLWRHVISLPSPSAPVILPRPMRVNFPGSSVTGQVVYCFESECNGFDLATGKRSEWYWYGPVDSTPESSPQPPSLVNAFLVFDGVDNSLMRVDVVPPPAPTPVPSCLYTFCSDSASCAGPSCTAEQGFVGCDGGVKRECAAGGESLVIQQYSNPDCTGVVTKTQTLYKDICMVVPTGGSYELQSCG